MTADSRSAKRTIKNVKLVDLEVGGKPGFELKGGRGAKSRALLGTTYGGSGSGSGNGVIQEYDVVFDEGY